MSELQNETVVILGAGQAGGTAASQLRQFGFEGEIVLIGDEKQPPYQRPPLSKAYLKGDMEEDRLYIRPKSFYENNDIILKLGDRVAKIDREGKGVVLASGYSGRYDKLIIATGSRARSLPVEGADLGGVQVLRTMDDVDELKPRVSAGSGMVIVGAGYIGLEAAAVGRQLGLNVTVLEAADRVLARVTSPVISEFYTKEHRAQGADVRLNASMSHFVGKDGVLTAVQMNDGELIPADIALVGIGILPNQELAADCGIICDNGIVTDEDARTSDPSVYAIGDCASRPIVHFNRQGRLESVHNALEQAKLAAAAICGKPRPKIEAPWFWSDQFDLKLQTCGLLAGSDTQIIRGNPEDRKFSVWYLKNGVVLAVDAINSPPDFLLSKKLVGTEARPDINALADPEHNIKDIVQSALAALGL